MRLIFLLSVFAVSLNIGDVREAYSKANTSEKEMEKFFSLMDDVEASNAVMTAYKGASLCLKAKFSKNMFEKKDLFKNGTGLIEKSLKSEMSNFEIRLIRLSIQKNAPKITGYTSEIEMDKDFLLKNYSKQAVDVKNLFKDFVKKTDIYTPEELKSIHIY